MDLITKAPVKEKRKNSEKRKEKSRDAARHRRSKESEIFSQLAAVLPLPPTVVNHLDKASVMRLIITNLRLINLFKSIESKQEEDDESRKNDSLYLKAVGGFILVLSADGDIIFISQNVSNYLGITQVDALGQNVCEITHPCDHGEINELFSGKISLEEQKAFFLRMKCLASKGRGISAKSSSYKVLHIAGRFVKMGDSVPEGYSFISIATPIPHPIDIEMPLGKFTFLSKHSLDMKFTFADERMKDFLGYNPESLLGKSMYDFHHAQDNKNIERAFRGLFSKGQSETGQYRFLAQDGGYVWVCTQATVIYCEKNSKPQSVVCVNYIISGKCEENSVYSIEQLESANEKRPISSTKSLFVTIKAEVSSPKQQIPAFKSPENSPSPRPRPATSKIFAPRTAEMNSEFLKSDDETGLTNDYDLTHLAPKAGDHCVPLENPRLDEIMPNYLLSANDGLSCPLVEKDISLFTAYREDGASDSCHSPCLNQSPGRSGDPFSDLSDETFDDPAVKTLLNGYNPSDDDLPFSDYIDPYEDNLPPLISVVPFSSVPWDINTAISESSSQGSLSPIGLKIEDNLPDFEYIHGRDVLKDGPDLLNSKIANEPPDTRKRGSSVGQEGSKKRKHQNVQDPGGGGSSSVLMNLLVAGHDSSAGYNICIDSRKPQCGKNGV